MEGYLRQQVISVSNPREVWLITVAHAVNEFYSVALPPILPLLVNDFAFSYGEAGILLTVFFATYSVFQLPAGILADKIGQRWLLAAGMITLAAGILVAASAQNYWTLIIAEVLAGLGGSTYHPAGMSLISDLESGTTEGKAMGIHGLGGVVGTALAPALIGGLAAVSDWRLALTVSAVVGLVYAFFFLGLFPSSVDGDDESRTAETDGGGDQRDDSTFATESRWQSTILQTVRKFFQPWVAILFLANLAIATEIGAVRTFVTSYLVEHAAMTAIVANSVFFVMLVGGGVSSLGMGSLADRWNRRRLGFISKVVSALVIGATAFVPGTRFILFVWFFLIGAVIWAALPAMNAITSQYSERESSGSLFGIMLTAGSLGGAIGPLLFGVVSEWFGLGAAFPMVAGVSIIGAGAFLALEQV